MVLNSREVAALIWLGVAAVGALSWRTSREWAFGSLGLLAGRLAVSLLAMAAYVVVLVLFGRSVGWWQPSLTSDTVTWAFGTALVLWFNLGTAMSDFWRVAVGALEVTAFVQIIANGYPFGVVTEVILFGCTGVIAAVYAAASIKSDPEHVRAHRVLFWVLAAVGALLFGRSVVHYVTEWENLSHVDLVRQLLLPVWLTLLFLPFYFLYVLYGSYEKALSSVAGRARLRAFIALAVRYGGDVRAVSSFGGAKLREGASIREALRAIDDHREWLAERQRREQKKADTLARFAGVDGENDDGRRLDRREFTETTDALLTLASAQMGHYRQRGSYRPDLVSLLAGTFVWRALPADHGIEMTVTEDGQAWWAWRRTPPGWVFAVGASGPPDGTQWMADGPEPPTGRPGVDPFWGDQPLPHATNAHNW